MDRLHRAYRRAESQLISVLENRKGEVKVSIQTSEACLPPYWEVMGFDPKLSHTKDFKICSPIYSAKHVVLGGKMKTVWFGVRIMFLRDMTGLHAGCCFYESTDKDPKSKTGTVNRKIFMPYFFRGFCDQPNFAQF